MHPLDLFKYCPKCGSSHFEIRNEKAKKCADCGFTYYFNSSAATVAFILNAKNELLVCRRGKEPAKGTLDLSGGFIDMGETGEEGWLAKYGRKPDCRWYRLLTCFHFRIRICIRAFWYIRSICSFFAGWQTTVVCWQWMMWPIRSGCLWIR